MSWVPTTVSSTETFRETPATVQTASVRQPLPTFCMLVKLHVEPSKVVAAFGVIVRGVSLASEVHSVALFAQPPTKSKFSVFARAAFLNNSDCVFSSQTSSLVRPTDARNSASAAEERGPQTPSARPFK